MYDDYYDDEPIEPITNDEWEKFIEYIKENNRANEHFEDEIEEEGYTDEDKYGHVVLSGKPLKSTWLHLNWNKFFNGEELNNQYGLSINFKYGNNLNYAYYTYACYVDIKSPKVNINDVFVQKSVEKLINYTINQLEAYAGALNAGNCTQLKIDLELFIKTLKDYK